MSIGMVNACLIALALGILPQSPATSPPAASFKEQTPATAGQGAEDELATILQSGSTNTRGCKVVIRGDGSATAQISGRGLVQKSEPTQSQQFPAGTIDTKTLRRLLREVGDVSKIPTGNCAKSVSFGTRTQIAYEGKTSGDLQCIRQATDVDQAALQGSKDLSKFVQTMLGQLRINQPRVAPNR